MIRAEGITKRYGNLEVLKRVDFSVEQSEIVSITGPSGAGKSTLLQILGTLDAPNEGKLYYSGNDISHIKRKRLAEFRNQHIGFIFQFHHLLPEFSAVENVCMPAFIQGRSKQAAEKRAKELLDQLKLSQRFDHKPNELSGGEQQRVAVARALMNAPDVIFADEPSGNLDSENAHELHELFTALRNDLGQTFVIVTHNMELARLADRVVEMRDGSMVRNITE